MTGRRHRRAAALVLVALAAGCGLLPGGDASGDGLRLSFEDVAEPAAFSREGEGRRDPGDAAGLWAVVADLPRPERALVVNLATGAEATVSLFRGGGAPSDIRLSGEAADALGIGNRPVPVRVTALRREASIAPPRGGF